MTQYLVTKDRLDALAVSVSDKSGEELPLTIDEMREAVNGIETGGGQPNLQAKTRTISAAGTFVDEPDTGYDGLSSVTTTVPEGEIWVGANHQFYTESNVRKWRYRGEARIDTNDGDGTPGFMADETYVNGSWNPFNAIAKNTTVTPSTSAQTIGGADYMMEGAVTVAAMPSGSVSASATKGSVSNHAISVTPTATVGTAGYLAAGSTNGTAVSVSASELVSGSQTITENGEVDVTNLASVTVNVSGGGTSGVSVGTKTATLSSAASSISFTGLSGNPTSFVVTSSADVSTGGTAAVAVAYDGTSLHGMDVTTQAEADTGYSKSYSGGTLTVTATTASFQANEYKLVYTYGGSSSDVHTSDVQVGSGATSITFGGLSGRPLYFSCVFKSDFSTSSGYQRVIDVVNDGTNTYGHAFDSSAHAATSWSYSYSGGSLTITSTGTNNGGYFHQPGYYQLTYAVDDSAPQYQSKTVTPTTSQQVVQADSGYDALESVTVEAMPSMTLPTAASGTSSGTSKATITPTSSAQYLNIPTGYNGTASYYTIAAASGGGGSASIDTKTVTASNRPSTLSFSSMKGQPIAFFLKATFTMTSSSSTYYYVDSMRGFLENNAYSVQGRLFQMGSTRQTMNVTSGYSASYSGTTLTLTSSGNRTTSPGCFYNGSYELVYVY